MASLIHPTAIVDPSAKLGENIEIGPYAVIENNVEIGDNTAVGCHARIAWGTRTGRNCKVFNGASVGTIPQDLKFGGEETVLEIGDNTIIREFCTHALVLKQGRGKVFSDLDFAISIYEGL